MFTLKIENQARDDHQVTLTVEFESGVLDRYKQQAAREFSRRMKIPGFRPGKAPYQVIVRQVGEAELTEHALEHLVDERYPAIIEESGIQPYGSGQLEKVSSMEPLTLEFVVPLEPVVTLGDYAAIRRPYELQEVTDADVDGVLENLRDQHAVLESANRAAAEGDVLSLRLHGERANPTDDQESVLIPESSYQFLIRPEAEPEADEWPFPGFSRQLIGLNTGDSRNLNYTFDAEYVYESLRGAEAAYTFEVEDVKSRLLPALDDEFAKSLGEYSDLDSVRAEIHQGLVQQNLENYNRLYDDAILAELIEQSTVLYPPQMLESEQNTVVDNFKRRLTQQGNDIDVYLKSRNMDLEALKEEAKPVAQQHLKRSLVLLEVSKAENIQVNEAELQTETMRTLRSLNESLTPEDARNLTDDRVMNNLVGNIMLEMLVEKAQERLHNIARGVYPPETELEAEAETTEAEPEETVLAESQAETSPEIETSDEPLSTAVVEENTEEVTKE